MARRFATILIATALAGGLQLGAAVLVAAASGRGILPVLREMAAELFGVGARASGWGGASLGLMVHLVMIAAAVQIYLIAARRFEPLTRHSVLAGLSYGILLAGMHALLAPRGLPTLFPQVVPLDRFAALAAWILGVGLPVGWIVARRTR